MNTRTPPGPMEPSVPISSVPMPAVAVASVRMSCVPVPTPVGVPRRRADHEKHDAHAEYADPYLPSSHGLTSVLTLLCPWDMPPAV